MVRNIPNLKDFKKDASFIISDEKLKILTLKIVINNIPQLISDHITELILKNKSYKEIGELYQINRSMAFKIHKMEYWPKSKQKILHLIQRYLEFIEPQTSDDQKTPEPFPHSTAK